MKDGHMRETMMGEIENIKTTVENLLDTNRRTRSDNMFLIMKVWCETEYADFDIQREEVTVDIESLHKLPSPASILRVRRKLQQEGKYPPPEETKERRVDAEKQMKDINKWWDYDR